jgi:hypothetical protein
MTPGRFHYPNGQYAPLIGAGTTPQHPGDACLGIAMQDPTKPIEPEAPITPSETAPQPGGFGAFADVYRARWAARHPNMRPREDIRPITGAGESNVSEPDPRRVHTEDGTNVFRPKDG